MAEDKAGVGGYILGALDTSGFEVLLEKAWWPRLRRRFADPTGKPRAAWTPDDVRAWQIHHPAPTPAHVARPYPSHLHIDLLPRLQGRGVGRRMMDRWLAHMRGLGSPGAHLGVGPANARALRFYRAYGWRELPGEKRSRTTWFAMSL
ncbi:MAG: GNAT family N-acetyltransferase [Caulobacteraceae bacterium]